MICRSVCESNYKTIKVLADDDENNDENDDNVAAAADDDEDDKYGYKRSGSPCVLYCTTATVPCISPGQSFSDELIL